MEFQMETSPLRLKYINKKLCLYDTCNLQHGSRYITQLHLQLHISSWVVIYRNWSLSTEAVECG